MFIKDKIEVKNHICLFCHNDMEVSYKKVSLDQPNLDQEINFYAPLLNCKKCNNSEIAPEFNDIQHEASCLANGVLNARQIKQIRDEIKKIEPWGSNNQDFSMVLGFGSSTIARYETCKSVPSMTHSNAISAVLIKDYRENIIKKTKPYREYLARSKNKKSKDFKESKSDVVVQPIVDTTNVYQLPGTDLNKVFINQYNDKSLEENIADEESFILSSFPEKKLG